MSCIHIVCLKKTQFEWVKPCKLWPLDKAKKMFGPPEDMSCSPLCLPLIFVTIIDSEGKKLKEKTFEDFEVKIC